MIQNKWKTIDAFMRKNFNKKADISAILFLIGMREYGHIKENFSKEEKVKLMDIALARVLSKSGFFESKGIDESNFPVWEKKSSMEKISLLEQETILRAHIVEYFEDEGIIDFNLEVAE